MMAAPVFIKSGSLIKFIREIFKVDRFSTIDLEMIIMYNNVEAAKP